MSARRIVSAGILGALVAACSGESSETYDEPLALTRVREAGADENCANGGVVIESGLDDDKSGVLDDDEVDAAAVQVVCAGQTLSDGTDLRRVDPLAEGDSRCPDGGVAIHTGKDDDADGVLGDPEIEATQVVCNSERPHAVLTRATALPVGSPECRYGGRLIEAGLDDGAGEGAADDGALADGEVDTSYADCNATPPDPVEEITPPDAPAGTATIDLRGGSGGVGAGGGSLRGVCSSGVTRFFPTDAADARFDAPALGVDLGTLPFEVTVDTALKTSNDTLAAGDFYYDLQGGGLQRWTGTAGEYVTGLRVAEGVTLTLPATTSISLGRDVEIAGRVVTEVNEVRSLEIYARNIVVADTGSIDVPQNIPRGGLVLNAFGKLAALGQLTVRGEGSGANGGPIELRASGRIVLDGTIDASGADGGTVGGAGGLVRALPQFGGLWSAATIRSRGGSGAQTGGDGGTVQLGSDVDSPSSRVLDVRNTGAIDVRGGAQLDCGDHVCRGGVGGTVRLQAQSAALLNTGALTADGGASQVAAGGGGQIELAVVAPDERGAPDVRLAVSGTLSAVGGAGSAPDAQPGGGGSVTFQNCIGAGTTTDFLGYARILLGGGDAETAGQSNSGGGFSLDGGNAATPAPRAYLYVPIEANAGAGAGFSVGGRIALSLLSGSGEVLPAAIPSVVLGAAMELGGIYGGSLDLSAFGTVKLLEVIDLSGRDSTSDSPGRGGNVNVRSLFGDVIQGASLRADGAGSSGQGGGGGCLAFEGRTITLSGDTTARGGDATGATAGGEGGTISYTSHDAEPVLSGMVDVAGGAGTPVGAPGVSGPDIQACERD